MLLAIELAALHTFTSDHYFMGAVTVCFGFVIGSLAKRRQISRCGLRSEVSRPNQFLSIATT